jgi:hypothetical protein
MRIRLFHRNSRSASLLLRASPENGVREGTEGLGGVNRRSIAR